MNLLKQFISAIFVPICQNSSDEFPFHVLPMQTKLLIHMLPMISTYLGPDPNAAVPMELLSLLFHKLRHKFTWKILSCQRYYHFTSHEAQHKLSASTKHSKLWVSSTGPWSTCFWWPSRKWPLVVVLACTFVHELFCGLISSFLEFVTC